MSFITNFMKNVKDFYSEINGATLTGAIDVIVVENEDGTLNSSPFHVRFGKMGVLKAREKIVDLEINGDPVEIWMKLDDTGAAFFVEDVDEDDEAILPADLATSPLPSKRDGYFETDENVGNETSNGMEDEAPEEETRILRKKRRTRRELMLTRSGSKKCPADTEMFDMDDLHDGDTDDEVTLGKEVSISELVDQMDTEGLSREPNRVSFSSGYFSDPDTTEASCTKVTPDYPALMSKSVDAAMLESEDLALRATSEPSMLHLQAAGDAMLEERKTSWRWGELPRHEPSLTPATAAEDTSTLQEEPEQKQEENNNNNNNSWFSWSRAKKPEKREEIVGVYLDDIEQNPDLVEKYIGTFPADQQDPLDVSELAESTTPVTEAHTEDNSAECEGQDTTFPDAALSLCRGSPEDPITLEKFQSHEINYSTFVQKIRENPNFVSEKEVLIRLNEKYLSWEVAAPIILSSVLFKQPLPTDLVSELTKECQNVSSKDETKSEVKDKQGQNSSSWFGWFGKSNQNENVEAQIEVPKEALSVDVDLANSVNIASDEVKVEEDSDESDQNLGKRFRKTIRLTSDQLKKLNLKRGSNDVEFSVTTAFQGTTRCKCHIYLWHHSDKIVISDIDGTITKSDVLGHLLPVIGRDWAQSGVAQLYTKIRNNGYQIIYLSARAIGQAAITKDYLQSLKQGDVCLPDGPLFLNPDSLIHAFKREVIDRNPEEFKIRCLKDIQSLFDGKNPFFAGYGNRPNDAYAYRAVGIPVSRIFTINPAGELRHELTQNFQTSYESLSTEVDYYFPNIQTVKQIQEKFNAFPRKQSVYFDASDYMSIEEVAVETAENLSDTEEQIKPFRLRSGTDISDSLSTARLKLKHLKNKKIDLNDTQKERHLLTQKSLEEEGFEFFE